MVFDQNLDYIYLDYILGRCAKTKQCSYRLCETKNKQCGRCILTTKHVRTTNYYYDIKFQKFNIQL